MIRIVILGGGFGGIRCALDCAKKFQGDAKITVIDQNAYHSFPPALYEIASAYQPGDDPFALEMRRAVTISYGDIFEGKHIDFIQAEIVSVDLIASHVVLGGGSQFDFDYAVFSLGGETADFNIPGVYEYAYQFKTVNDAIALHSKLQTSFKDASQGLVALPMKFLIIGAGFTGIELAAELMSCGQKLCRYHGFNHRSFSSVLFETGSMILPMIKNSERKKIVDRLTSLGVVIMADSTVESVSHDSVKLKTGETVSGTAVIWTAGVQPNKLLRTIHGLPVTDKGKVVTDNNLRVKNYDNLFAIGDCVEFIDPKTQKSILGLAYHAIGQGKIVASNILAVTRNRPLTSFKPRTNSWVVPVGGKFALVQINSSLWVSGFIGWLIRLWIDARYFFSILPFKKALSLFKKELILFVKND